MIDRVDQRLCEWIKTVLGDVKVSFAPPGPPCGDKAVHCYLLELAAHPPLRGPRRPLLQIALRYLITAHDTTVEGTHLLLGPLVFAALAESDWEVRLEPVAAETWAALNVPPQPAMILSIPLQQERTDAIKRVRQPLELHTVPMTSFRGRVLGPGDIPIAGARVALPSLQLFATTDPDGYFLFPAVPAAPGVRRLHISAKGKEFDLDAGSPASSQDLATITLDSFD